MGRHVPQWGGIVVQMIMHIDETRIDAGAGMVHRDAVEINPEWGLSGRPNRLDHTILHKNRTVGHDVFLRRHPDHSPCQDV